MIFFGLILNLKTMKIAIISSPYLPVPPKKYGWTERVIFYLIKGLQELGHEPILIWPGDSDVSCEVIPTCEKSINFWKTPEENIEVEIKIKWILDTTKKILHSIKWDVDIIHSHGFDLLDFRDVPNITTLHGPIIMENMQYYEERRELFYASISKNQQEAFPGLRYCWNCYNWIDPDEFPFNETPEDYICFIGRFDETKNPHLAIQLALQLWIKLKMWWKIDFFGFEYFIEEIKPYLNNPLIEYLWELEMKDKIELISNAKCNIHPTGFREPFGLTVLESAYCGTPTLAIKKWSMPELIEEWKTGILVEDFEEWYHKIQDCFDMDRTYISSRTKSFFNYKNMTLDYLRAYNTVIQNFKERSSEL